MVAIVPSLSVAVPAKLTDSPALQSISAIVRLPPYIRLEEIGKFTIRESRLIIRDLCVLFHLPSVFIVSSVKTKGASDMSESKNEAKSEIENDSSRRGFITSVGAATGLAALGTLFGGSKIVNAQELGLNAMGPTPEQAQALMQLPDRPVVMVNLLKFSNSGAGADDYAQYGRDVGRILASIGAEIIFSGVCQTTFIGGAEWDSIAAVRYPNARALLQMAQSAEYQAISSNRSSGLEGQVNLAVFETDSL